MFKSGKQLVTSSIAGLAVIGTVGFLSQTEVHADTTETTGTSDVQTGGNAVTATTSSEESVQSTNTTSSTETTQDSNKNQVSEAKQSNQQSTTTSLTAKSSNDEGVSLTTESSKQGNDVVTASKDMSTSEAKDNKSTDAKVKTTNSLDISKLTINAIGLAESKALSTTGTDNQQYGSDMTSRFYGSGQSASHNVNQTDPTADYMGHTDRYFSDAQVETNVDNIPVNNKGFQFGNNVWQIQLPKEITSLSDWISKLNSDPDYTIGVIDEAGQRHYLTADSLKPFTNSQINSGYTFDAVNMDSTGKWVKVGTWVVTYTHASDGYPCLILGCEMTEWPKSLSVVPPLPVFVTSPNQKRIFNVRASQYNGAITGAGVSDDGSSIYAPIGPEISETGRDMSAHNYGATYTMNSGQLSQGLTMTIDGGGNYNFAAYHSLSFSNGKDPAVDLNSAWMGELNAYDSNGNVIGKYKWQFNDEGGAPVGEQNMVGHGSWIKYVPNNPSSGVAPMPLVARYLSDNNGEEGKVAFTFMPNAYASRPTSLDIKKVIIHYVDAETGESLNQDEVYEITAQRSNTDNSWTNATPTVHKISGDKTSTFSNLSVTSNGTFKFSVKANDPNQTTFNAQFTIPTISKLNVNYPVDIYKDWNPYTLTVQVVQPKIDYQIKYVDAVTGQTVGTQNVSDKGVGNHTINYAIPDGYQLVPASDYPKTVKSDNGQLLFDDQASHAHVTNATVIPVKVVKNNATGLTSNLVKLHQGISFNKDTFASLVPTISVNSQNATDKGELTYSYDGIQKYGLDTDAQGRVEQIQLNKPGLVAKTTFQGNLGNLVDQNGNPSTAINKIVREYYALEPGGRLAIYKASENMYGADHSPFYLNGFLYNGAKAIKIVTHYYDNSGNELKINLASDVLPVALTGMHTYTGTVSGVKLEDPVESNVASNQSVLVKNLADGSTLVSSIAGDHNSYRPMGIAGTSQGAGYIIGSFDPTTGEASTGTSKNLGYVMLSQPYDIQMSDSLQMKTVEAKRTIHFIDNNGNKVHDDVEQNVSWLQVYQDGKLLNTTTDKSFNSIAVPTIAGQTPSVTVVPTESVSADSPVNESYIVTYVSSSTVTVNVAKPGETITITPDSQDKHGYDDAYFKQTIKRVIHYTDQTGKQTDYDGGSVTFTRNGHWDPINNKMTFDNWSNGGSYTFPAATTVILQLPTGYTLTGDYQADTETPNVDAAIATHGTLVRQSYVGVKANAQQLTVRYMNGSNQVGSMNLNGVTDQEVNNFRDQVKQNLPIGYALTNENQVAQSYKFVANPSAVDIQVMPEIVNIDPNNPFTYPSGYTEHDFKRTITRDVTITEPNQQPVVTHQMVTFTRGGKYNQVTKQVTYDAWSENGSHQFAAVAVPVHKGYTPSQATVDAITVTPDSQNSTVYITYKKNANIVISDPSILPADSNVKASDLMAHNYAKINMLMPDGTLKQQAIYSLWLKRSVELDPVTDQLVKYGDWKIDDNHDNAKYDGSDDSMGNTFDKSFELDVPKGYHFSKNPLKDYSVIVNGQRKSLIHTYEDFNSATKWKLGFMDDGRKFVYLHSGDRNLTDDDLNIWINQGIGIDLASIFASGMGLVQDCPFIPNAHVVANFKLVKDPNIVVTDPSTLPADSNVKSSDLSKTIQRIINIIAPDGKKDMQTQTVTFTRSVELDPVTDQLVKYRPWSENGSHQFVAVNVPSHKGYTPSQKSIDAIRVTPDSHDSTIDVTYRKNPNLVITDPSQLPSDSNVKADDLSKTIQRQVTITSPNGKADSQTQSVTFTRGVELDPVTDQLVKFLPWSENGQHTFEAVKVPILAGYQASGDIPAQTVTPDTADTMINITYEALGQNVNVKYVDGSNNPVGQQVLAGKTDQTKQLVVADFKIPQGWQVVGDLPTTVHFVANNNPDIVVKLAHILTPLDPTKPDTWPSDAQLTPDDFSRTIKRTVTIHPVSGEQQMTAQSVTFTRGGKYDEVLHKVIFDNWSDNGQHTFEAVVAPTAAGYSINGSAPTETVTPESARDQKVDINYVANGQSSYYSFVDDDLNGKAVGAHYAIAGKTDQKIDLNIMLPANYQLANGQRMPTSYTFRANDNQPVIIHLAHKHADGSTDANADVKRTITRTINVVLPDGKVTKIDQSTNFTRSATKDLVTNQLSYGDWSNKGQAQLPEFIQDDLKGYNKTGSAPALTVTPDSKDTTVQLGYVKQADKVIKADDPSTWPAGITKNDLIRTINRDVTINEPSGKTDKTHQTVTFKRNATQDPVTDSITFEPWSENSSHVFEAVNVPTFKGYTPSQAKIDSLTVTPDSKDSLVDVNYSKNANVTINDPKDLPSDSNVKASDLVKTITRTITIDVPNGKPQLTKQMVTFKRGVELDPVTDQLVKYLPWSENGQHEFEAISVPSFKGYTPSQTSIDKEMVTPDSKDSSIDVNYKKNANITVNDPKDLPSDSNVKASDLSKTITRTITINIPNGEPQVTTQTVTFKRGVELDPVTDQLVKYLPWSENGKHDFDAISVPNFKGYTPSQTTIAGETVTPDTKETDANVVVNYTKNANIVITDPSRLPSDSNVKADDLQKIVQRVINITDPAGKVTNQTQSVTFKRGVELDPVTDQLVKYLPWSENGQHIFSEVSAPKLKGYDKVGSAPTLTVTSDSTNSVVELGYRKQADKVISADDPSTWPSRITKHDLIRDIKRTIKVKLPDGTTKTKVQSVEFKRNATQDPVTDRITFGAWSHNGKYQFDAFTPETIDGYEAKPSMVTALEVTPDSKDSEVVINYQKLPTSNDKVVDKTITASTSQPGSGMVQQSVATSQQSNSNNQPTLPQTGNQDNEEMIAGTILLGVIGATLLPMNNKRYE